MFVEGPGYDLAQNTTQEYFKTLAGVVQNHLPKAYQSQSDK